MAAVPGPRPWKVADTERAEQEVGTIAAAEAQQARLVCLGGPKEAAARSPPPAEFPRLRVTCPAPAACGPGEGEEPSPAPRHAVAARLAKIRKS
ncbi:unnamed protein product [Caretta caretta]